MGRSDFAFEDSYEKNFLIFHPKGILFSDIVLRMVQNQRHRLHERGFIWKRIENDAVTPSVYTTQIETVAETESIWKGC